MRDNGSSNFGLGIILGGVVLLALAVFLVTGGDLGGTKRIESDADLPQVTSPTQQRTSGPTRDNTGAR
jgi:hypothetical protein